MNRKTCPHCGESKPEIAFGMKPGNATGTHPWCRVCQTEAAIKVSKALRGERRTKKLKARLSMAFGWGRR